MILRKLFSVSRNARGPATHHGRVLPAGHSPRSTNSSVVAKAMQRGGAPSMITALGFLQPRLSILGGGGSPLWPDKPLDDIAQLVSTVHRNFGSTGRHRARRARMHHVASLRRRLCSQWRRAAIPAHVCCPDGLRPPLGSAKIKPSRSPEIQLIQAPREHLVDALFGGLDCGTADFDTPSSAIHPGIVARRHALHQRRSSSCIAS